MNQSFQGWQKVAEILRCSAAKQKQLREQGKETWLNDGQQASILALADRIANNGVVIADEVGMGKTRVAVELAHAVVECKGRVAILIPPGLGYQWQDEIQKRQDERQKRGRPNTKSVLRSFWAYLKAWKSDDPQEQAPWFNEDIVLVSHSFTNWRLGNESGSWRWALLPRLFAEWRKRQDGRLPRGSLSENLSDYWVCNAAESIVKEIPEDASHPAFHLLDNLYENDAWNTMPLRSGDFYHKHKEGRIWLERAVGIGLGVFDLVIIDEAHKSRAEDSGLSRLLSNVILPTTSTRRVALTATPVELHLEQWKQILQRIQLDVEQMNDIHPSIETYIHAVQHLQKTWRSNERTREEYKHAAKQFQSTLSPFLLRRDKREDQAVKDFQTLTGLPASDYRYQQEIPITTASLSASWKQAICAAEALSVVANQADDPKAKRLRLTLGNGHGISSLIDQYLYTESDKPKQDEMKSDNQKSVDDDEKRQQRIQWWLVVIGNSFEKQASLYDHPAILATVEEIEKYIEKDEKVLVFGRFTQPMRALVNLLNARQMLHRLQTNTHWPQATVHQDEEAAVQAACTQLQLDTRFPTIESINRELDKQYHKEQRRLNSFRNQLIDTIQQGLGQSINPMRKILHDIQNDDDTLIWLSRAMYELLDGNKKLLPKDYANTFIELINAIMDTDNADHDDAPKAIVDTDNTDNNDESNEKIIDFPLIRERLGYEYNHQRGSFARFMYGETKLESRRVMQVAFNRLHSFPKVLVAQSMVGREGLNLHKACRVVILLHPEWNPGIVEQQIGRVDRVGSHWENTLVRESQANEKSEHFSRIEIRPVVFRGTYDEHNWKILQQRWHDLRAQLHGIVITASTEELRDTDLKTIFDDITANTPNFSPSCHELAK